MIKYAVLGSGSSANSYIIQYDSSLSRQGPEKAEAGKSEFSFNDENNIVNCKQERGNVSPDFQIYPDNDNLSGISRPGNYCPDKSEENNSYDKITIVIDNGFSLREFTRRASELGFDVNDIDFIFLTHDHSDHIKGVSSLSRKYSIPVVMGKDSDLKREYTDKIYKSLIVEGGKEYSYNSLKFSVFRTFHDSDGSVGYSFNFRGKIFTIITDTGVITDEMEEHASGSDVLFLEANYCPDMLENGPYPWFLKKRIASELGHLSNNDAVEFLKTLYVPEKKNKKRKIYFCHLSDKNNCPDKLDSLIKSNFTGDEIIDYRICRKGETVEGIPVKINQGGEYE